MTNDNITEALRLSARRMFTNRLHSGPKLSQFNRWGSLTAAVHSTVQVIGPPRVAVFTSQVVPWRLHAGHREVALTGHSHRTTN